MILCHCNIKSSNSAEYLITEFSLACIANGKTQLCYEQVNYCALRVVAGGMNTRGRYLHVYDETNA